MLDTPTDYAADSGNNGVLTPHLNPLHNGQTLSNGNLDVVGTSSMAKISFSTIAMSSGKVVLNTKWALPAMNTLLVLVLLTCRCPAT